MSIRSDIDDLRRRLDELVNGNGLESHKRPKRKDVGKRTHEVVLTDEQLVATYLDWEEATSHTDNPTIKDSVILREMLEKKVGQNLDMVCIFWLRNEMVALRKNDTIKNARGNKED